MSDPTPTPPLTVKRPKIKYQVFVSSPYLDLAEVRERVIWAILEARQIPVGMESFGARNDRGWDTIRRVIDDTDYYILVLAGKYGSVDEELGISWTEREYDHAISLRIPVLAFFRDASATKADQTEIDPTQRTKLEAFRNKVQKAHLVKRWREAEDLCSSVSQALHKHIQDDEGDEVARPGWVRGTALGSPAVANELARLSAENERLRAAITSSKVATTSRPRLFEIKHNKIARDLILEYTLKKFRLIKQKPLDNKFAEILAPTQEAIETFVSSINRAMLMQFQIHNAGNGAAQELFVDFKLTGPGSFMLDIERPGSLAPPSNISTSKTNNSRHCYAEVPQKLSLRHRVKHVVPGGKEELVRFLVVLDKYPPQVGVELLLDFSLADTSGSSDEGQVSLRAFPGQRITTQSWTQLSYTTASGAATR